MKRYFIKGKKIWYEKTLIEASKGLKPKLFPLKKTLYNSKIYWTLDNLFDFILHLKKIEKADLKYPRSEEHTSELQSH